MGIASEIFKVQNDESVCKFNNKHRHHLTMADMDPIQMQIEMIKAQAETQKNMFRQMYTSDPAMVEQMCSQIDQSLQMQIQMLTQMMGAADGSGFVDPEAQARMVMQQMGYDDEQMSQMLGGDEEETLTESVMGAMEPSQFGYGDIESIVSSLAQLPEVQPEPADPERKRRFEILLTGILSTLNDHRLDGLDVEPRDEDSLDLIRSLLSNYWGVEDRESLIDTLRYLIASGHSMDYANNLEVIANGGSAQDLHGEDMDDDDIAVSDSRFAFTEAYAVRYGPMMLRGWDLGRAANVTRWRYFVGFITEDEAWDVLDQIADGCIDAFESWTSFAQSYIFGSMFWKCPYGPDACYENAAGLMFAVEHLLTEGEWKDFPWVSAIS